MEQCYGHVKRVTLAPNKETKQFLFCKFILSGCVVLDQSWSLISFKVLLVLYKAMHGPTPDYIIVLATPYVPQRQLRSANDNLLIVSKTQLHYGDMFTVAAVKMWNYTTSCDQTFRKHEHFQEKYKNSFIYPNSGLNEVTCLALFSCLCVMFLSL